MLNINFNLRDAKAQKATPVNVVLRYRNQKLVYPSGLSINPKYWNTKEQKAKQTKDFREFPEFNRRLQNLTSTISYVFMGYLNNVSFPKNQTVINNLDTNKKMKLLEIISEVES